MVPTVVGPRRIQTVHALLSSFHDSCSGRPQCWRHENFPYINVSQAHDTAAGVRFKAQQFFEYKDIVVSFPPGVYPHHSDEPWAYRLRERVLGNERVSSFRGISFDMLMAKGCIYGDERWLVGEDYHGHITLLRF
ncbi:hypothetical protein BHE90_011452 [Fusarium euwallaceae]|uniref:Uncharacterized protein n=2 Tax=Fusarium solani species complex TaxID=232080 RepID=A0A430LEE7_9HYPO|nr:hypothetical protein CDV31_006020 [Fusarium ambrosium]RTE74095.1 hypothetical protein BHE90_011452 [Fusarium euwallaceae]